MSALRWLVAAAAAAAVLALPGSVAAAPTSFSGSCRFAGPITPNRPITLIPVPGARFSYTGVGACDGTLGGAPVQGAPITVTFADVTTPFDTCELGPDLNLHGVAEIGSGDAAGRFAIVVNLARLALVGPFLLTTPGGGAAIGLAQFMPANPSTALQECVSPGLTKASLTGQFRTIASLTGEPVPYVRRMSPRSSAG